MKFHENSTGVLCVPCQIDGRTDMTGLMVAFRKGLLTLKLLMSYIYGAPSKARNANVVYIWTYVWQR